MYNLFYIKRGAIGTSFNLIMKGCFMKKYIISLILFVFCGFNIAYGATSADALNFLNKYISAANSYSDNLPYFYLPTAIIQRVVIKPDGSKVMVPADVKTYIKQMKLNSSIAKIRKYTNSYSDMKVTPVGKDFRINCKRKPSLSDYKLNAEFVVGQDATGAWKIKKEVMETKEQIFLMYAPKK